MPSIKKIFLNIKEGLQFSILPFLHEIVLTIASVFIGLSFLPLILITSVAKGIFAGFSYLFPTPQEAQPIPEGKTIPNNSSSPVKLAATVQKDPTHPTSTISQPTFFSASSSSMEGNSDEQSQPSNNVSPAHLKR